MVEGVSRLKNFESNTGNVCAEVFAIQVHPINSNGKHGDYNKSITWKHGAGEEIEANLAHSRAVTDEKTRSAAVWKHMCVSLSGV